MLAGARHPLSLGPREDFAGRGGCKGALTRRPRAAERGTRLPHPLRPVAPLPPQVNGTKLAPRLARPSSALITESFPFWAKLSGCFQLSTLHTATAAGMGAFPPAWVYEAVSSQTKGTILTSIKAYVLRLETESGLSKLL